ncbi:hypothetical protein CBM2614_U40022 [Cupriavidus taiwanensis]|nr:hypothetical protein CBM2614_U40022 [Cupriavidus taiwanensis]
MAPPDGPCHALQDFLLGFILTLSPLFHRRDSSPPLQQAILFSLGLGLRPNAGKGWRLNRRRGSAGIDL